MRYLSNTFPDMTEHEKKLLGRYTVSWYDEKLKTFVAAKYSSIYAYIFHNKLKKELELEIIESLNKDYRHETKTANGIVGIYRDY